MAKKVEKKTQKKEEKKEEENYEFPYCTSMSKYSCKFHRSGCFYVNNIKEKEYLKSRQAAIDSGRKTKEPCLVCKP